MRLTKVFPLLLASIMLLMFVSDKTGNAGAPQPLPNPVLVFVGPEPVTIGGQNLIRYHYMVDNFAKFPKELFAASPALPPCGLNTKASRTWVDFFDSRGKRLNGFCALGNPSDLNKIWFALDDGEIPPSYVYIEMNDRQTSTKYKSNLADTVL